MLSVEKYGKFQFLIQDEIDMELGVNSDEPLPKEPMKKDTQDPKQNLQTLLQRQAKFLESCREVKVCY